MIIKKTDPVEPCNPKMKKIEPFIRKIAFNENNDKDDLQYWLSRSPEERIAAMSFLREHYFTVMGYAIPPRIEKIVSKKRP